jgi:uncharacterized membrane protein YgdD (TMEM256/DUF423 family)
MQLFISRFLPVFIGVSGSFCVLFGAWLAHAGKTLSPDVMSSVNYAHQYQFIHTLALLAVTVWLAHTTRKLLVVAAILFVIGILFFSGTIYLKTLLGVTAFSKLTPIGGMTLALAWLLLAFTGIKK